MIIKRGARILAFEDSPFTNRDESALILGILGGNDIIEGVLSFRVNIGKNDSTDMLLSTLNKSRFREQVKLIALNGITFAGLNLIDLPRIQKETGIPVIAITRKRPRKTLMTLALKKGKGPSALFRGISKKIKAKRVGGFYVQYTGEPPENIAEITKRSVELLRVAHLITSGIAKGESKGRI